MPLPKRRVSVLMLMDEIKELSDAVSQARAAYQQAIEARNAVIVELRALDIPRGTISRLTGLSKDSIAKITAGGKLTTELMLIEERTGKAQRQTTLRTP